VNQKTVTLSEEHHRFQQNHLQLGPLVRDRLDGHLEDGTFDELPKSGSQRRDIETVRTSILIKPRHQTALEQYDVNLSQAIGEIIDSEIDRERKLRDLEERWEKDKP